MIAVTSSGYVHSTSYQNGHTDAIDTTGADALLVAVFSRDIASFTGFTHNGDALTAGPEYYQTNTDGVKYYYLLNPDQGAAYNLVASLSAYKLFTIMWACLSGVDSFGDSNGVHTYGNSPSHAVTTGEANNVLFSGVNTQTNKTITVGSGQTEIANVDHSDSNLGRAVLSYKAFATPASNSVSVSWSGDDNYSHNVFEVIAAAGGTSTNASRSAVLIGESTANASRSAVTTGEATANAARSALLTGEALATDERDAVLVGSLTSEASRTSILAAGSGWYRERFDTTDFNDETLTTGLWDGSGTATMNEGA